MKKIVCSAMAVAMFALAGCKTPPSEATMYGASEAIGRTAGYAVELSKTKQEVKDGIIQVLDVASAVTPKTNETFVVAWTPIVEEVVAEFQKEGKVDATEAMLIKSASLVACEGIDYVFIRYPEAKKYQNLVSAAVDGFVTGFKAVVKSNGFSVDPAFDQDAYNYLKMKMAARKEK